MESLTVVLHTVTPLFLGGASPNEMAELRPPSIKGVLRFWYRALDRGFATDEPAAFGGSGANEGQAPLLLHIDHALVGNDPWNPEVAPQVKRYDHYNRDSGRAGQPLNGIAYLGYTLILGDNDRRAIRPDAKVHLVVTPHPRRAGVEAQRAWAAALWCLAHFGGLGSRSRRGFGSLYLAAFDGWPKLIQPRDTTPDADGGAAAATTARLPQTADVSSPEQWLDRLREGIATLRQWYPQRPDPAHPVFDGEARILLIRDDPEKRQPHHGYTKWEDALNAAGLIMQRYRHKQPDSEYRAISAYLHAKGDPDDPNGDIENLSAPSRAAFGLPLQIRSSGTNNSPLKLTPATPQRDRQPSPLFIRVARIAERYYPLFVLLNGPYLDASGVRVDGVWRPFGQNGRPRAVLNAFLDHAVAPLSYGEVRGL